METSSSSSSDEESDSEMSPNLFDLVLALDKNNPNEPLIFVDNDPQSNQIQLNQNQNPSNQNQFNERECTHSECTKSECGVSCEPIPSMQNPQQKRRYTFHESLRRRRALDRLQKKKEKQRRMLERRFASEHPQPSNQLCHSAVATADDEIQLPHIDWHIDWRMWRASMTPHPPPHPLVLPELPGGSPHEVAELHERGSQWMHQGGAARLLNSRLFDSQSSLKIYQVGSDVVL